MNKTVTINISGIIFHIEEDAYEKLSKYLQFMHPSNKQFIMYRRVHYFCKRFIAIY